MPRHIFIKLSKIKYKEKILKPLFHWLFFWIIGERSLCRELCQWKTRSWNQNLESRSRTIGLGWRPQPQRKNAAPVPPGVPCKQRGSVCNEVTKMRLEIALWKPEVEGWLSPSWLCVRQTSTEGEPPFREGVACPIPSTGFLHLAASKRPDRLIQGSSEKPTSIPTSPHTNLFASLQKCVPTQQCVHVCLCMFNKTRPVYSRPKASEIKRGFELLTAESPLWGEALIDQNMGPGAWNVAHPNLAPALRHGSHGVFHFSVFVFSCINKNVDVEGRRIWDQKGSLLPEQEGHWDWLKS